jgi:hypothetical protein
MKKFIVSLFLMMLTAYAAGLFLPWWSLAFTCFLISALIPQKKWISFVTGFLSQLILWGGLSAFISIQNNHLLAHKLSTLLLKQDNPSLLILITALIGAMVGGFAAWSGSFVRPANKNN